MTRENAATNVSLGSLTADRGLPGRYCQHTSWDSSAGVQLRGSHPPLLSACRVDTNLVGRQQTGSHPATVDKPSRSAVPSAITQLGKTLLSSPGEGFHYLPDSSSLKYWKGCAVSPVD